jgi:hypothetical protein
MRCPYNFARLCLIVCVAPLFLAAQAPTPGQNVNMVSGTQWPFADPFLERQNEPSLGVSTRNPLHLLAGANDYRTVDLNLPEIEPGEPQLASAPTGEPWVGQYVSIDGGARWQSTLLPGYPQDTSPQGMASPLHCSNWPTSCPNGFTTAADPVIAAGTNGMFYYAGIAFNRGTSQGLVFVARYMDLNNKENGDVTQDSFPIRYIDTVRVASGGNGSAGTPAQFLDKPWLAVDIPRGGSTCSIGVPQGTATVPQTIPAGNVYVAYANVSSSGANQTSTIYFSRSTNCGAPNSWSAPVAISRGFTLSQGATIQVDPETGIVYVAWRVIHGAKQPKDGIAITASLDGGLSFLPAITLVSLPPFNFNNPSAPAFFDQNTTATSFRTTAYPALAVADSGIPFIPGPVYLAWSQHGAGPNGEARIMMLAIPGNAGFTSGGFRPPTPFAIDNGAITNDVGSTFLGLNAGHQMMPAMTFNQGKLMVLYYDLRQDHTIGEFAPSVDINHLFTPDSSGNFFEETRDQVPESPTSAYLPDFISDAGLTQRRHTIDLVLAQSDPAFVPSFTYTRVSRYDFGLFESDQQTAFHQLKFDPPNLPMFLQGSGAFLGDYTGITGQPFVLVKCGSSQCWTYNNPSPPGVAGTFFAAPKPPPSSAVHYATWTSNQDVIPPPANAQGVQEWDTYTAIGNGSSKYNNSSLPSCNPGFEGDRNQNVYSSRIGQGLLVSSPQTSKPLSASVQRGFVVLVQNQTSGRSTSTGFVNYFRLRIANQPANGFASFAQLVPPSPVPVAPFPAINGNGAAFPSTSIDVAIAPHTGVARTLFAVSSNPTASILVNVTEITGLGGSAIAGGMSAFILLNADGTVPGSLVDPNGQSGSTNINNVELYDPNVSAPNVSAPNVSAPNVSAPNVSAPNVSAPNVSAPNVSAPNVSAPNVSAYGVANPNVSAPNVSAPNVSAAPPSDGTYTITNDGNTTTSFRLALVGATATPLQLLLSQVYMTPQTDGQCHLTTQQQNITLANVPNVPITPVSQLSNPNVSASPVSDTTVSLAPGDQLLATVRGNVSISDMEDIVNHQIAVVAVPHAINSNDTTSTTPPIFARLFIVTASLPNAVTGQSYSQTLSAIGGTTRGGECTRYSWSWSAASQGGLPPGLNLSSDGVISGTPTSPGSYDVLVRVRDCGEQTATRALTLTVLGIPDLIVESFTHSPAAPTTVDVMTFTAVVRNVGNSAAPASNLRFQIGGETFPPQIIDVPSLAPGEAFTATRQLVLGVAQDYLNTATADSTNTVTESNENNNVLTDSFVVTLPRGNLSFVVQPNLSSGVGQPISPAVKVRALDNSGASISNYDVTLGLGSTGANPGGGSLSGTLSAATDETGTATFSDLAIDQAGSGYTLVASGQGTISASSSAFNEQVCLPFPAGVVPFTTIFYVTRDSAGDIFVVGGRPNGGIVTALSLVPLPNVTGNEQFCSPVTLETNYTVPAYVPSAAERNGIFTAYAGLVLTDPNNGQPFPGGGNIIPTDRIDSIFAWRIPRHTSNLPRSACSIEPTLRSIEGTVPTSIQFNNQTKGDVNVYGIDNDGQRVLQSTVASGQSYVQSTFLTNPWVTTDAINTCVGIWLPTESAGTATITSLARPAPPTNLTGTAASDFVSLAWTAGTSVVPGYNVYRATASGGPYTRIASVISSTSHADTTAALGIAYFYVVTSVDNAESVLSNEVSVTVLPPVQIP